MAANPLVSIFRVKELRERLLFTMLMLVVFRLGAVLPIPGINVNALKAYFLSQQGTGNAIVDYLDFFAGGAFTNFSIFMLGIMPYISMSIIMQLFIIIFPSLKRISEEEGGRKKIQWYQRLGTIVVCLIQSFAVSRWADTMPNVITMGRVSFTLIAMMTVTTGTMFLMWIGEQITRRGIGNGTSLIIFAGIVARLPRAVWELIEKVKSRELNPVFVIVVFVMFVAVVALVVFEQQGQRKIPVNYAKRVVGRRMYGAQNTYIPFKINPSGVIPVIFASSLLTFPLQIASGIGANVKWLADFSRWLNPHGVAYNILYTIFIIFFAYFYTQVTLNPIEIAKNIRENGGSIPGIRTDKIEEYLTAILNRIILPGSLYLALIAILPTIIQALFNFPASISYLMGGTSLLILVGVDLDTMSQVDALLKMHHHEGIARKGHIRSRNL
ncbi:MAG TPA: preprotein translocase subunit SecY [Termitinemataceae bacterium]|uniref:preprotein translocase subunit SecY n=1 Tax=Treponema sp. J25 TaxID=2094121 RepID=UPI001053D88C|nr:preprotein translocase subunit SecY [Treponema sp. J25]TCW61063.1 preprotein translocase subunit SecY [Treponema sp. J25]HOJ99422.1 preprotein translocase subunit SecY [Termitinemataceae bacterium]HOM23008.1 preprotein translocase subunit SecY [Termitinemataceae bacterium]HPQ00453.1 preprotein translocase subunit SecY [Termitinemataceae bacterium]